MASSSPLRRALRPQGTERARRAPGFQIFRETISELRKVVWPTREQATRLTILVIIISAFVGAILGALDLGFGRLFAFLT